MAEEEKKESEEKQKEENVDSEKLNKKSQQIINDLSSFSKKMSFDGDRGGNYNRSFNLRLIEFNKILAKKGVNIKEEIDKIYMSDSEVISHLTEGDNRNISLIREYRSMIDAILPLKRIINIFSNDLLCRDDVEKKSLRNLIDLEDNNDKNKDIVSKIEEEVIEPYDLELMMQNIVPEVLITGSKGLAIYTYEEITNSALKVLREENKGNMGIASESETFDSENKKDILENYTNFDKFSKESFKDFKEASFESFDKAKTSFKNYVDEKDLSLYTEIICGESFITTIELDKNKKNNLYKAFNEKIKEIRSNNYKSSKLKEMKDRADENLLKISKLLDKSIHVMKDGMLDITLEAETSYFNLKNANKMRKRTSSSNFASEKDKKDKEKDENDLENLKHRAIIVDYNAENIIPILESGKPLGFYVVEEGEDIHPATYKETIGITGYMDDNQFLSNDNGTEIRNNYMSTEPGNLGGYSGFSNTNSLINSNNEKKRELIHTLSIKLIKDKLKDDTLEKNKKFLDVVSNLIRKNTLMKKNIRISFVEEERFIYFHRELDENKNPKSILSGALFFGCMYLSSIVSSLNIKLSKNNYSKNVTVEVGMGEQIGGVINNFLKNLYTRDAFSESKFTSPHAAIKASSNNNVNIIPKLGDTPLYTVEPLEKINDVSIDDEFTANILNMILGICEIPSSIMNVLDENEYATSLALQNRNYLNNILNNQIYFQGGITKLLKILCKIHDVKTKGEEENDTLYAHDLIDFKFSMNTRLGVSNLSESLDTLNDSADKLLEIIINENDENSLTDSVKRSLKIKILKKLGINNIIDLEEIEKFRENLMSVDEENDSPLGEILEDKERDIKFEKMINLMKTKLSDGDGDEESDSGGSSSSGYGNW